MLWPLEVDGRSMVGTALRCWIVGVRLWFRCYAIAVIRLKKLWNHVLLGEIRRKLYEEDACEKEAVEMGLLALIAGLMNRILEWR